MKFCVKLAFVLVATLSASASAEIVSVAVTGNVSSVTAEGGFSLDGSVNSGTAMSGVFTYDTEAPDLDTSSWNGKYEILSVSMNIGNYTFANTASQTPLFNVYTVDPVYSVNTNAPDFQGGTIFDSGAPRAYEDINWGYTFLEIMNLWTSDNSLIPDATLPDTLPDISVFDMRKIFSVRMYQGDGDGSFAIDGVVTSVQVVPEPCIIGLLATGGLMLGRVAAGRKGIRQTK